MQQKNLNFWKATNKFSQLVFPDLIEEEQEESSSSSCGTLPTSESDPTSSISIPIPPPVPSANLASPSSPPSLSSSPTPKSLPKISSRNDFHHSEKVKRSLVYLYENFISAGGPEEINVSIHVKKRVHDWFAENVPKKEFPDSDNLNDLGKSDKNLTGDIFALTSAEHKLNPESINLAQYEFLYSEIPKTLFDESREHILNVLRADSFRRFIQSNIFREMAKKTLSSEWLDTLELDFDSPSEITKTSSSSSTVAITPVSYTPSDPLPTSSHPPLTSEGKRKSFRVASKTLTALAGMDKSKSSPPLLIEQKHQIHEFLRWWGSESVDLKN